MLPQSPFRSGKTVEPAPCIMLGRGPVTAVFLNLPPVRERLASEYFRSLPPVRGEAANCMFPQSPSPIRGEGWGEGKVRGIRSLFLRYPASCNGEVHLENIGKKEAPGRYADTVKVVAAQHISRKRGQKNDRSDCFVMHFRGATSNLVWVGPKKALRTQIRPSRVSGDPQKSGLNAKVGRREGPLHGRHVCYGWPANCKISLLMN